MNLTEYTVLAADDEQELLDVLDLYLSREGIRLIQANDGAQALSLLEQHSVHLAILDIMMPGVDGLGVLRRIRETSRMPVIMLTAKAQDYDKIMGLGLGADDYVTKPFNPMELVARVQAQLRRCYDYAPMSTAETSRASIELFDLTLLPGEGRLLKGGADVPLTSTELKILKLLMQSPGRIFTKRQIFEHVWQDDYIGDDNTIMVHLSNLRAKIEDDPRQPAMIKTIKGLGYRMERDLPL